jgi:pyruvate dehydrogenase E1 component
MVAHQQKKLDDDSLRELRDRFNIPVSDADIAGLPFRKPADDSDEMRYLHGRRKGLGGYLPMRKPMAPPLAVPPLEAFQPILDGTGEREISTTMAFVRILTVLLKDKNIGKHIVPIVPDEARTFGMEGLFSSDRHLLVDGSTLHASRRRYVDVLSRRQERTDARRGH